MNEIATPTMSQLPALPTGDIKHMVDKVGAYVDALTAAKRAATDQSTINEIDEQIRKYSAFKIRCQMELGERTAKMEQAQGQRTDKLISSKETSKKSQLQKINMTEKQAWQNEQLIKPENKPIVERYIQKQEESKEVPTLSGALKEIMVATKPHVVNNSGDNEWYTPSEYIEAARDVMGCIDLDPASNDFANQTVKASVYYTAERSGLEQEWWGHIWMNPPYSNGLIKEFVQKLLNSQFLDAIVLVNNATDTAWFRSLTTKASAIVFTTGRIHFEKHDGARNTPIQGQAFIYFGDNSQKFLKVFKKFGWGARL